MARQKAKEATASYLEGVALWYLERYPGSEARVRRALRKRVKRSVDELGTDPEAGTAFIELVVAKLKRLGLIDDARFARARVRSLRSRGKSARAIMATLRQQGVAPRLIEEVLADDDHSPDDAELEAARRVVRRKRLGRHRRSAPSEEPDALRAQRAQREKDLARLARAGFSFDVARRAIDEEPDT